MKPIVYALLAMISWGLAPILSKIGLVKMEPFTALTVRSVAIAVIMVLTGILTGKLSGVVAVDTRSAIFIIGEGLFAALLGQLAYYYALKTGEVSIVSPLVAAFPIITVILALLFLGEEFTLQKLIGVSLILAGVMVIKI